jgi:hypothetical protein
MLAELPVGNPRTSLLQPTERQRVEQHGAAPDEGDVGGARVAKRHAVVQGDALDL